MPRSALLLPVPAGAFELSCALIAAGSSAAAKNGEIHLRNISAIKVCPMVLGRSISPPVIDRQPTHPA